MTMEHRAVNPDWEDEAEAGCCECTARSCCKVTLTGCLGCIWRRRKKGESSKCDMVWLSVLVVAFLLSVVWLQMYLALSNSFFTFDWHINGFFDYSIWIQWHIIGLATTGLIAAYITSLMLVAIVHACLDLPIYISFLHRQLLMICSLVLSCAFGGVAYIDVHLLYLLVHAFKVTAPFVHIGLVFTMTLLTFLIAGNWLRVKSFGWRTTLMIVYVIIMLLLYLSPLILHCPLVTNAANLPPRPTIIAHRGASSLAPENTWSSLHRAATLDIKGVSIDVQLSYDRVPFLMSDHGLRRTTNVLSAFPPRFHAITAPYWNKTQLEQLDAGSWFLEDDPYMTVSSLSRAERKTITQQKVLLLADVLAQLRHGSQLLLVDVQLPGADFPKLAGYVDEIAQMVLDSGIDPGKVLWLQNASHPDVDQFSRLWRGVASSDQLDTGNFTGVLVTWADVSEHVVSTVQESRRQVVVEGVNSKWLYSILWVMKVDTVLTDYPQVLVEVEEPIYIIEPMSYLIIWTTVDAVSLLAVILLWGVQLKIYFYRRTKFTVSSKRQKNSSSSRQNNSSTSSNLSSGKLSGSRGELGSQSSLYNVRKAVNCNDIVLRGTKEMWNHRLTGQDAMMARAYGRRTQSLW